MVRQCQRPTSMSPCCDASDLWWDVSWSSVRTAPHFHFSSAILDSKNHIQCLALDAMPVSEIPDTTKALFMHKLMRFDGKLLNEWEIQLVQQFTSTVQCRHVDNYTNYAQTQVSAESWPRGGKISDVVETVYKLIILLILQHYSW